MIDTETGYPLYEYEDDDFCDCEEDKLCSPCRAKIERYWVQAGLMPIAPEFQPRIAAASNASAQMDLYTIDLIRDEAAMNGETKPAMRETMPAKRPVHGHGSETTRRIA